VTAAAPTLTAPATTAGRALSGAPAGLLYLVAFAAAAVAAGLGRAVTTTYLPVLLNQVENAPGLIGTVMLVNAAAGFGVPLVVGLWSDRRGGRRLPFVAGGALVTAGGLAAIALGNETSYLVLAVFGAVTYTGLNAITTAHRALIADSFAPTGRARATSVQELALLVGSLLGVAVGGSLTAFADWAPFALAAVVVPLLAAPTLLRTREDEPSSSPANGTGRRAYAYYGRAAARPAVRNFLLAHILWVLGYAAMPVFFVLYAERVLDLTAAVASIWLVGFGLVTAATMVAAGRVKDPARHRPLLVVGVALMGAGFLALGVASTMVVVAGAFATAAAGFGLISTLGFPLFSALVPEGEEGGYTALYFSVRAISSTIALPAAGWAIEASGSYRALFLLGGLATLAALIPLLGVRPERAESRRRAALALPSTSWWRRSGVELASVGAGVLATAALLAWTPLQEADERLYRLVNGLAPAHDLLLWTFDPHTRNYVALIALTAVAALFTRGRPAVSSVALVFGAAILAWGLLEGAYAVWDRPRPEEIVGSAATLHGHTWAHIESFPSGHMAITTALAAAAALAVPRLRLLLFGYVAVVAFTRVLFGAHFPLDTVAGIALGAVSARVVFSLFAELGFFDAQRSSAIATRSVSRTLRNELGDPS
jgi:membrane-associated phospholipid phosphatase/predicted MFS family arabinose efflux permease